MSTAPLTSSAPVGTRTLVVAPFALAALLPFLLAPFPPGVTHPTAFVIGAVMMTLLLAAVLVTVRRGTIERFIAAYSLAYLAVLAFVRHGEGGSESGLSPLVLLPLLAIATWGSRLQLGVYIVGIVAVLGIPIVLFGSPMYDPSTEIRRTVTWIVLSLFAGPAVRRLVNRARENEARYRSVFDNVREIVFQTDRDGHWTLLNPAWRDLTGYDVQSSLGTAFADFMHPDDRAGNVAQFERLRDHQIDEYQYEMRYRVADGSYRWFEVAAQRTEAPDGSTDTGVSGTLTDITDRYEADRLKEEFFALVSHELRTPLAAIIGYMELLDEVDGERLSEDGTNFLAIMQRNGQRLMRLIGDLLFTAQVEAGTLALVRGSVDVAQLTSDACSSAHTRAADRDITLDSEIASDLPAVEGDRDRLGQVLDNLLTNALKFTGPGGRVVVRALHEQDSVVLEVEDTGDGIPAEDQERLFDRFARGRAAEAAAVQGVGLGLAITKAIVDAHGGRIGVQSEVGVGTTFRVELPTTPAVRQPVE